MPTTILDNETYTEALQRRYFEEAKNEENMKLIQMAEEACSPHQFLNTDVAFLERFAALVAEPWIKTNKALAKEIIELKKQVDISALPIIIEAAVKEAVLVEREGCAVAAEQVVPRHTECGNKIAAAIRARGDK